jgi:hypothetical protein
LVLWFWLGLIITVANAAKDGHLNQETWHETWHESALLHFIDYLNHFEASYWHSMAQLGCNLFGTIRDWIVRVSPCFTTFAGIFWCGCVREAGPLHQHESLDWRSQGRHWVVHRRLKVWTI